MSDEEIPPSLSALSPELIDNILLEIDSVYALGNFIIASRYVRRCFQGRKHVVVWRVLQNELGPVLKDAEFLRLLPHANPGNSTGDQYRDWVQNMAAVYREILRGSGRGRAGGYVTVPSFAELIELCRTLHTMNFLASTYITAQLRSFSGSEAAAAPPSRVERLRVLRAFYRRQIVCNAWSPTRRAPRWTNQDIAVIGTNTMSSDLRGAPLGLFAVFEPWELQQVDHADWFVTQLCAALCAYGIPQPIYKAEFGDIFFHPDHLVQYMREYPRITEPVLRDLLPPPRRSQEPPDDVAACSHYVERYNLLSLHFLIHTIQLESFPDPTRHQRDAQPWWECGSGLSVQFVGDAVDLPPFGWVDALDGNCFEDVLLDLSPETQLQDGKETYLARYLSLDLWRRTGFALWDQRRVEALRELDGLRTLRTGWLMCRTR
ncbi:hypothetical protein CONLIGDRAFT_283945 [Coniochaeta ligniaria NRRL 30616]|uniref:Uncharacterized protein n=1 Tax=Coniochaeta ligniaria NRRL 30616 TaxID=1408157 RepID=A0A1J7JMN0_9PEZI|nr:hypothetical protein CONLIGDRAFT_283945 [Coniochaeta ligniaria NRRL 30616]